MNLGNYKELGKATLAISFFGVMLMLSTICLICLAWLIASLIDWLL